METVLNGISLSFNQMMGWELAAVVLAIAYLLLIMRENIWGWVCALISTAIYTVLFWEVNLLMDSALNVYYMGMAVYGWYQWQGLGEESYNQTNHKEASNKQALTIVKWKASTHLITIILIIAATLISGYLLSSKTQAAWPYLDSFTTWASVFTTYMVAKKVLENWLYWIVIDAVALCLYIDRELYLTAALFFAYLIICVLGFLNWKSTFNSYEPPPESTTA